MMTVTVTLKYYLGQVKTGKGIQLCAHGSYYVFHFPNDKDLVLLANCIASRHLSLHSMIDNLFASTAPDCSPHMYI